MKTTHTKFQLSTFKGLVAGDKIRCKIIKKWPTWSVDPDYLRFDPADPDKNLTMPGAMYREHPHQNSAFYLQRCGSGSTFHRIMYSCYHPFEDRKLNFGVDAPHILPQGWLNFCPDPQRQAGDNPGQPIRSAIFKWFWIVFCLPLPHLWR